MFLHLSVCSQGVSRSRPRGESWGVWPEGCLGPDLGGMVGGSGQGGVSRPTPGGCSGPHLGMSRPRPRPRGDPGPGVCIQHTLRQNPSPSRRLLLRAVRILLECILVWNIYYYMKHKSKTYIKNTILERNDYIFTVRSWVKTCNFCDIRIVQNALKKFSDATQ